MEFSPQHVRSTTFASARKGYDPDQVDAFVERAASALEAAQNHATAMEAKARAAVAKLQEHASTPPESPVPAGQADEISRTLLLAQRAADEAIAQARAEADRLVAEANSSVDSIVAQARSAARTAGAQERDRVRSEVDELLARREFLAADVAQLESFLADQRSRLRDASTAILDIVERVPAGLGASRAPLLSAADAESDAPETDLGGSDTESVQTSGDITEVIDVSIVAAAVADGGGWDEILDVTDPAEEQRVDAVTDDDDTTESEFIDSPHGRDEPVATANPTADPTVDPTVHDTGAHLGDGASVEDPDGPGDVMDPTPRSDPRQLRFRTDVVDRSDGSPR